MAKNAFSSKQRATILAQLEQNELDILIIGGGITGAGIALDAVSRGMSAALLEMQDFAAGTSSRSTKLVHGGLRYLKQLEIKMVAEVGKERAIVYENGPHVTTPEWMLLPIYRNGTFGRFFTSIGLRIYDFLAGVKKSERRSMLTREQTLHKEPMLRKQGLQGAGYYVEYRTDDARLTIEVLKKAVSLGAAAVNYAKVEQFIYKEGKVVGVTAIDQLTGKTLRIHAKKIINAAGPWVDALREKDGSRSGKTLHLTKGVHLVFDAKRFPLRQAVYFDTPDGRMVFAIPRDGKTYVGTTDTNYKRETEHPRMTVQDRDYLLAAIHSMFPDIQLTAEDVESSWSGLRPLIHEAGKDPSEISRKDEIFHSQSGLISIAGGKLTGYRKMAETVVDDAARQLEREGFGPFPASTTRSLPISGGDFGGSGGLSALIEKTVSKASGSVVSAETAELLTRRYGSNVNAVLDMLPHYEKTGTDSGLPPNVWLMLIYSIEQEMAVKPVDFFVRRTGTLFFNLDWVKAWKDPVVSTMAEILGWTEEEMQMYTIELETEIHDAVVPAACD